MRAILLLAFAGVVSADDLPVWVVRVTTERASFGAPSRQTLLAPALPVEDGCLLVVGFALEPSDDKDEALKVTAIDPKGAVVPAELVGGDEELRCTLFRLPGKKPEPVALEAAPCAVGDEVVLLSRHGELMRYAPRRGVLRVDAAVASPRPLFALSVEALAWQGAIAMTPGGKLLGFVDNRPTVTEGDGIVLGLGAQTPVLVPADAFADVPRNLPRKDRPRGWLGVNLAPFDEDREAYFGILAPQDGALVTGVSEGSPADRAGIRLHDVVQSIGDLTLRFDKMEEWGPMLRAVQRLPLGKPLKCRLLRFRPLPEGGHGATPVEVELTLEARPLDFADAPETELEDLGFRVKPLTQDWRRSNRVPADLLGVVVTRTEHASAAQIGGLAVNDLILKLDDRPIADIDALKKALADARDAKRTKIVFFVRRGQATLSPRVPRGSGWGGARGREGRRRRRRTRWSKSSSGPFSTAAPASSRRWRRRRRSSRTRSTTCRGSGSTCRRTTARSSSDRTRVPSRASASRRGRVSAMRRPRRGARSSFPTSTRSRGTSPATRDRGAGSRSPWFPRIDFERSSMSIRTSSPLSTRTTGAASKPSRTSSAA